MNWNWKGFVIVNVLMTIASYIGYYGLESWWSAGISFAVLAALGVAVYLYKKREERVNRSYKRQSAPVKMD